MCQPNTVHTLTTFTVFSTTELAVPLSCPIYTECKIDDDSSTELETFLNLPLENTLQNRFHEYYGPRNNCSNRLPYKNIAIICRKYN